jgi:ABC-type bacteriocin/lantibiotic exporter with double-glycine peptidase domain
MNTITLLTNGINDLWFWTYSIIAGWSLTFTILVVGLIIVVIRTINLQHRVDRLEQRLVHAERDYNLSINNTKSK